MAQAVLALGANMDDPPSQLAHAVAALEQTDGVTIAARSNVIATEPWGDIEQAMFSNMAVMIDTTLSPEALLDACLAIEESMGRKRTRKWGPRLIDIDIVSYDRLEMKAENLTLPHPYAHQRDFVLDPVREVAPDVADWLVQRV